MRQNYDCLNRIPYFLNDVLARLFLNFCKKHSDDIFFQNCMKHPTLTIMPVITSTRTELVFQIGQRGHCRNQWQLGQQLPACHLPLQWPFHLSTWYTSVDKPTGLREYRHVKGSYGTNPSHTAPYCVNAGCSFHNVITKTRIHVNDWASYLRKSDSVAELWSTNAQNCRELVLVSEWQSARTPQI